MTVIGAFDPKKLENRLMEKCSELVVIRIVDEEEVVTMGAQPSDRSFRVFLAILDISVVF